MSAIFGIFNLNKKPIEHAKMELMRESIAYWGPHGDAIWQKGDVALGHLLLHNTPESLYDSQPVQHPPTGIVLTAQARLDNRAELIRDLKLENGNQHPDPQSLIPDSQLILHAYLRWGEDCVDHLLGDWTFAIYDPRKEKLFLARDHYGISSLYYYRGTDFFAFASSIKGLLALPEIPQRPNLLRLAQVLTSWPGDGTQSAYEDIFHLPYAHRMSVSRVKTEFERYWNPEDTPPLRLASDDDYVDAFLEIYTESVHSRMRTPDGGLVGATLSSGFDSGSVCALAARELRAQNEHLPAFTSIPLYPTEGLAGKNRYGDEAPLVELVQNFIGNLDVDYINAKDHSPLQGLLHALEIHDTPSHAGGNLFWQHVILEKAKAQGINIFLTGQMGNGTVSWSGGAPENFWHDLLTGHWRSLRQKTKEQNSLWKVLRRNFLRPLALPVRNRFARLQMIGKPPWVNYAAINPQFASSFQLKQVMKSANHNPFFSEKTPRQEHLWFFGSQMSVIGAHWAEAGAHYQLDIRDPTMDKRLIEFSLAIPNEQYHLNGQNRSLIRRAMLGLLPNEVRFNTRKGLQAADVGHRLLAQLPQIQAVMAQLEKSNLSRQILDLPKMQAVLNGLQDEVNHKTTVQSMTILMRGMMTGLFLQRWD